MASVPFIERMTLALGNGITGLTILQEYGIKTGELEYFIDFVKSSLSSEITQVLYYFLTL